MAKQKQGKPQRAPSGSKLPAKGASESFDYKRGEPTKQLRRYFAANRKRPPTHHPHPQTPIRRTPRVREVKHNRNNGQPGKYATLASAESHYRLAKVVVLPMPDIVIHRGWLYVTGDAPCVGTAAVIAQAEGCKLLLYFYAHLQHKYCRICYLEGDPEILIWIYTDPESAGNVGWLSPGTYADADVDVNTNKVHQMERVDQRRSCSDGVGDPERDRKPA